MQHTAHLNTGFDFMLRYDEVQTEKKQAMLPFPTPSRHHLFISPFFFRVPIFAVPPCFCCPASRRTYRCHCQLFGPPVTLWTRAKTSSRKKTEKKKQIVIKFALNIHSLRRIIPDDLGDPDLQSTRPKPSLVHKKYENGANRLA